MMLMLSTWLSIYVVDKTPQALVMRTNEIQHRIHFCLWTSNFFFHICITAKNLIHISAVPRVVMDSYCWGYCCHSY
jgi:hypothetical protein